MNRIDLENRRAVVTGGAQGIGRAIAERLLASGAAYDQVVAAKIPLSCAPGTALWNSSSVA